MGCKFVKRNKGFTLIELIVVVVIIGLFSAVARPYYNQYQIKAARADVQAEMLRVAEQLIAYKALNNNYANLNPLGSTNSMTYPTVNPRYTLTLSVKNSASGATQGTNGAFELKATPITSSQQKGDGVICLNQELYKYWEKGKTACSLTATSTWYGS